MASYIARRLLLMIPTLVGILLVTFVLVQFAPGGPVEYMIARMQGMDVGATATFAGTGDAGLGDTSAYRGAQGLPADYVEELKAMFGLDKPVHERFLLMLWNYLRFDFGESYYRDVPILTLIGQKLPVSITLGLWTTLLSYLVSIPLGIRKAVKDGTPFDVWSSAVIVIGYAIPGFLFAILLIVLFSGGSFLSLFPLRGLVSDHWEDLSLLGKALDYLWHIVLPVLAMAISGFATVTFLTKNAFLDEIRKQYVVTARSKGVPERRILYGHVFRNAMLIVIAGFPAAFIHILFTGSLLIENIFSLDGLGLLAFESIVNRDYAVVFASLYIFSLIGLAIGLVSDLTYAWVDPRIDFETREV
ncbi:MAG: microcin C ABC transporter permease YejB [Alphaproteobacteria bacterium]|nr:microcin C ABC transporter permease YejB [Alphaproteobacteria bacterium]